MGSRIEVCFFCEENCIKSGEDTTNFIKDVGDLKDLAGHVGGKAVCVQCAIDLENILVLRISAKATDNVSKAEMPPPGPPVSGSTTKKGAKG